VKTGREEALENHRCFTASYEGASTSSVLLGTVVAVRTAAHQEGAGVEVLQVHLHPPGPGGHLCP